MSTQASVAQRVQLAQETRERFVANAGLLMAHVANAVQERLSALINESAPSREMQSRRDAWTLYQGQRKNWLNGTLKQWQAALKPPLPQQKKTLEDSFELVGTEVADNRIIASRLVQGLMETVGQDVNDLLVRIKFLAGTHYSEGPEILLPEVLVLFMVEEWALTGMQPESWAMVNEVVLRLLKEHLKKAYKDANEFLIKRGVLPTIEFKDRVKRMPSAAPRGGAAGAPPVTGQAPLAPLSGQESSYGDFYGGAGGQGSAGSAYAGVAAQGLPSATQSMHSRPMPEGRSGGFFGRGQDAAVGERQSYGYSSASDETRLMTVSTPLARARSRAQGVLGQLKRLLVGSGGADFEATHYESPSPALAAAMAERPSSGGFYAGGANDSEVYSSAGVARVAGELRQRSAELKEKAETKSEKATIEIVALMFQSILQEERIPPGIRVWFARLQMPVLRLALAEPDFFGTLNHPARQLIDRMGACVMGFDASGLGGGALETEIKRIVQVIEQYPETGKRVYQLVYEEFQKFLKQFLTHKESTKKLASVAQLVEERETLTIQYTIEMRNMLKNMPVRDEVREFLFKVWAEVLSVAALRKGPQDPETLGYKKLATDLVWAASAKPNRVDRARVIQDLPMLLQKLRAGMTLLGVAPSEQDTHIKTVSDTLADAFLSKTQAIAAEQITAMAERLANLEDFLTDDGTGDLPLDAESIEMMLGIDASMIDVVADGGSKPSAAMLAWAQELELGSWFTLDHNARVGQVQFVWRSERKHLNLFAATDGHSYLIQGGRLAAYLQAGLLLPQEEEALTVRATRDALGKLEANPERLLS